MTRPRRGAMLLAIAATLGGGILAAPAGAQWTRVAEIIELDVPSLFARADTLVAGVDTAVYISTNAGASWQKSAGIGANLPGVSAIWLENGRIITGSFGQGVHTSNDLGASWLARSGGLAGPGSHHVNDLESRGGTLFDATDGSGVFALDLGGSGPWQLFGIVPQKNQASGIQDMARSGNRLLAVGGANGHAFWNDTGMPDWTVTPLDNVGVFPGLQPFSVGWTGTRWMVGTNIGFYRSVTGAGNWEYVGPSLGLTNESRLARRGSVVFVAINRGSNVHFYTTGDDGTTWVPLETLPTYVYELAIVDTMLYAARWDGLWRRSVASVLVPGDPPVGGLEFALVGSNPVRGEVRFEWRLADPSHVSLEVFDAQGRSMARLVDGELGPGPHEAVWVGEIRPGVYLARISTGAGSETLKFARLE
jgi:hypothetical protein